MKTPSATPLKSLVQTLNDGIEFYRTANLKVEHEHLKTVCSNMIEFREFALAYLQPYIVLQSGAPEDGHTFGGKLHHIFTEVQDNHNTDHDLTLIKQLEAVEDETQNAMATAAKYADNVMVQSIIRELTPRLLACRERASGMEKAVAA